MPWIKNLKAKYPYDLDNISKLLIGCKAIAPITKATGYIRDVSLMRGDELLIIVEWDHRINYSYINFHADLEMSILIPEDKMVLLDSIRNQVK